MAEKKRSSTRRGSGSRRRDYERKTKIARERLKALGVSKFPDPYMSPQDFESFVQCMLTELILWDLEGEVFRAKKYTSTRTGRPIVVDVSVEFAAGGARFTALVECKLQKRDVEVAVVRELKERVGEIGAHKGVIVSTSWFQRGAIELARACGIALIQVEQTSDNHFAAFYATSDLMGPPPYWSVRRLMAPGMEDRRMAFAIGRLAPCLQCILSDAGSKAMEERSET